MKAIVILFFFFFINHSVYSQNKFTDRLSFAVNGRYGFIIPHRTSMVYLIEDHVKAWDFTISLRTKGDKPWQILYNVPDLGVGFYHANLGNARYLGTSSAFFGFIRIPIIKKKSFNFSYSMGEGIAILSNPFNTEENIYNVAIGSHVNAFIDLSLFSEFKITDKLNIVTGLSYTHYSNGAWRKPNLGFNIPAVKVGINYSLGNSNISNDSARLNIKEIKTSFEKKNEFSFTFSKGVRENPPPNGRKFYTSTICINVERLYNPKRKFGTGLDIFYDPSLESRIISDSLEFKAAYNYRYGIHLSYDLVFNRVSFTMQTGAYFFTKAKDDGLVYSRFGLRAKVWKNITASLTLKTHFVKADVIEWGIGYTFQR